MNKIRAFTLIELMVVIVIIAIFVAIAIPGYQDYLRKKDLAIAKQESSRIATELERFKAKNFSYKGFDPRYIYTDYDNTTGQLYLPVGTTAANAKYLLTLVDLVDKKPLTIIKNNDGEETAISKSVKGLSWAMKVERLKDGTDNDTQPKDPKNYDLLLHSDGLKCMTKTANIVKDYQTCGSSDDVETW